MWSNQEKVWNHETKQKYKIIAIRRNESKIQFYLTLLVLGGVFNAPPPSENSNNCFDPMGPKKGKLRYSH